MKREHIVVVGGTRGIGRAVARVFHLEGCRVSVLGRRAPAGTKRLLAGARFYAADLSDGPGVRKALARCVKEQGRLNHLVFCQRFRGGVDDWDGEMRVGLTATREIIEFLKSRFGRAKGNSIVVIGSAAGSYVCEEQPASYHAAKAALRHLVRFYAVVLGPLGIRVNEVSPTVTVKAESRAFYAKNRKLRRLYERITPLGRMGAAADVAFVVRFLCGPEASFITGQEIVVDGGLSLVDPASLARRLAGFPRLWATRKVQHA